MYLLIVFLPLVGSIAAGVFSRVIGEKGAIIISTSLVGLGGVLSIYSFYEVGICGNKVRVEVLEWVKSEVFIAKWGLLFDSLTVVMLVVVMVVSTLVHLYASEYMEGDPHRGRFFSYLSLFTFFMLILVCGDNYLQLFVGWEGVGLCSYLLINFWYTRIQANKAAIQAMLVNRVGDVGLALGIGLIYKEFKSVEYEVVFSVAPEVGKGGMIWIIGILLLIGAVGKSAQLGLHTWLPNAMEGPTPVSALIHAATMVTAGVYLLGRSSPLLEYGGESMWIVTIVGGVTALFAGTTGLLQNDLKRVIAYSTASQLGYMVFACGLSGYDVGIFHLGNHAFFKALLFLSAGVIIHGMGDEQDMRRMGGLGRIMPYTYAMMMIGSMALMGIPFLTGYYSKDVILEIAYATGGFTGMFAYGLGTAGAFFTAFYSMRLLHLTFLSRTSSSKVVMEGVGEGSWRMLLPLFILCVGSIFVGYVMKDMIIGVGTDFWNNAIFVHPEKLVMLEAEFLPTSVKWFPVLVSLGGVIGAWIVYSYGEGGLYRAKRVSIGRKLYIFLNRKWYFDIVYREWISQGTLKMGYRSTYNVVDKGVLEMVGPRGISEAVYKGGYGVSRVQSGNIYHYVLVMIIGILVFIGV